MSMIFIYEHQVEVRVSVIPRAVMVTVATLAEWARLFAWAHFPIFSSAEQLFHMNRLK